MPALVPARHEPTGHHAAGAPNELDGADAQSARDKRRLLLLVRTGLTLGIGYLLLFSAEGTGARWWYLLFVILYLASNVVVATLPARVLSWAAFDVGLVLVDTAMTSFALYLIPQTDADVFVFYFAIIFLASVSDRLLLNVLVPVGASMAYLFYLVSRHDPSVLLRPAVLLRVPFFLLAGAFYGFLVDRFRRDRAAAVAAAQRAQGRMEYLSVITHDLKQPLWLAQQAAGRLYDQLNGRVDEHTLIAQVMVNLHRMQELAVNFLEFNRIESRGVRVVQRSAPLNQVLEDLVDAARPALDLKHLQVDLELATDLPAAFIDPPQLERALANLVDNAVKFTPEGGTIVCRTAAEAGWITVTIGDSGPGIGPERVATLFTRFQQGADAAGRRSTGLGLYIARAIIVAHGGEIALDTSQPCGAWFVIRLPVAHAEGVFIAERRPAVPQPAAV